MYGRMYDKQSSRLEADLIQFRYLYIYMILMCDIMLHDTMKCVMLCGKKHISEKFSSTSNTTSFFTYFRPTDVSLAEPSVRCHVIVTAGKCKGTRGTVKVPHTHMHTVADIHTWTHMHALSLSLTLFSHFFTSFSLFFSSFFLPSSSFLLLFPTVHPCKCEMQISRV